jgi:predicted nucleic acid-binding protein
MRLYLDVCALNRPYDDQSIDRNRLEAEAILVIVGRVSVGRHTLVSSEIIDREVAACPDLEKAELVGETLRLAEQRVVLTTADVERFRELDGLGFRKLDAMHLACAEAGHCEYFVTTDDKLIKRAKAHRKTLAVSVVNPLTFVTEVAP